MTQVRLLDQPADYQRLGVNPNQVEVWEDGRRNWGQEPGNWEWWYFDSVLDDGSKAVAQFFIRPGRMINKAGDHPSVTIRITTPDGQTYKEEATLKPNNSFFSKEQCDVHIGDHSFVGNLQEYHIHVEPINGLGLDLNLTSTAAPYRPGSGYFGFGDDEYYTWFCVVPAGKVSGTITVQGEEHAVSGTGYHDHQWGNRFYMTEWNNWLWARQNFGDYSVLMFDLVAADRFGYQRFPIMFIEDQNGQLVFENRQAAKCTVDEFYTDEELSGKDYPKSLRYEMTNGDKKVTYSLQMEEVLEAQGLKSIPFLFRQFAKKKGVGSMSYSRYYGQGSLRFENGGETIDRSGNLIYEFMFPGDSCREVLDNSQD